VRVLGYDVNKDGKKIREKIGVVQQDNSFDFATVKQNFDIYGFLWGIPKKQRDERGVELMRTFGLDELSKMRAFDLSGGQQRRLQVAREFIHGMDLLFLDEPTVGLDPLMRRKILDLLKEKARKDDLTILFTTHNLEEADYICDRVAIMDKGVIQALDTVENLKRRYGGTKAIEVSLAPSNGVSPSYTKFFERLGQIHADIEVTHQPTATEPAILVSREPEKVIETIVSVASEQQARIEWLNIRKSTLEDVFIQTVSDESEEEQNSKQKKE
jgi:ABC-2 type transport system ATP-binding protein